MASVAVAARRAASVTYSTTVASTSSASVGTIASSTSSLTSSALTAAFTSVIAATPGTSVTVPNVTTIASPTQQDITIFTGTPTSTAPASLSSYTGCYQPGVTLTSTVSSARRAGSSVGYNSNISPEGSLLVNGALTAANNLNVAALSAAFQQVLAANPSATVSLPTITAVGPATSQQIPAVSSSSSSGLSTGTIAGIVIGSIVGVILIIGIVAYFASASASAPDTVVVSDSAVTGPKTESIEIEVVEGRL